MIKLIRFLLAISLIINPLAAISQVKDDVKNPKKENTKEIKIATFGDSLISGYGVGEFRDFGSILQIG